MKIIKKDGKEYLKIGDRAVEISGYDKNGKPVIKPRVERIKDKNGKEHVKIIMPSLKIRIKNNK